MYWCATGDSGLGFFGLEFYVFPMAWCIVRENLIVLEKVTDIYTALEKLSTQTLDQISVFPFSFVAYMILVYSQ